MTTLAYARRVALGATLMAPLALASAQSPGGGAQAIYQQPMRAPSGYVNAHGEPVVRPASYGHACGPQACGPGGYGGYGPGGGGAYTPFPGSGMNMEQCGPHYFDFAAEYLFLSRDAPLGDSTVLSTFGFANNPIVIPENQIAIDGGDVGDGDGDYNGYRLTGRLDVGALSVFEFSYSGLYTGEDEVTVTSTPPAQSLFSVFSAFGSTVGGDIDDLAPNFAQTDDAQAHRVGFESEMHSAEANLRRYWVGYNPRFSGTLLLGFRYIELQELLEFDATESLSAAIPNSVEIELGADNRLSGAQVGGDAWMCVAQGVRIGSELKLGILSNDYRVRTQTDFSDAAITDISASLDDNEVSFLTEFKVMAVANVTSSLSIRGGYELLYISDLALAGDNLTANPPYGPGSVGGVQGSATQPPAAPPVNDQGDVFWSGFSIGAEYTY